jgi:hypothetical protein
MKDAISVPVKRDTITPSNSTALPVEIMGANGMVMNVTTGDLNIQSNHADRTVNATNVPGDSIKIGDGTTLLGITAANEAKVNSADLGAKADAAATTDIGTFSLIALFKRALQNWTSLFTILPASLGSKAAASSLAITSSTEDIARIGIITETAPASDTASSGLNGRLQRIAQNLTTYLPNTLGSKAAASSLAVTQSTEDIARIGIITETAPASDIASSGLNGRLQRIAQNLTSILAILPTTRGPVTSANSLSITPGTGTSFTVTDASLGLPADAAATTDTGTFAAIPLLKRIATNITTMSAKLPTALGITTAAGSLSIAPASDASFSVVQTARAPTYAQSLVVDGTTAVTLTAPGSAKGCKVVALNTNAVNLRITLDGSTTPTATVGISMEPGRSEDFIGVSNLKVIGESTTSSQGIMVHWYV